MVLPGCFLVVADYRHGTETIGVLRPPVLGMRLLGSFDTKESGDGWKGQGREVRNRTLESDREARRKPLEVIVGRRLWGEKRRIDVALRYKETRKSLGIECRFQRTHGTANQIISATIENNRA